MQACNEDQTQAQMCHTNLPQITTNQSARDDEPTSRLNSQTYNEKH